MNAPLFLSFCNWATKNTETKDWVTSIAYLPLNEAERSKETPSDRTQWILDSIPALKATGPFSFLICKMDTRLTL